MSLQEIILLINLKIFSRVIADIDCKGLCGNYEKEIAEMFIKAFENSEYEYGNGGK